MNHREPTGLFAVYCSACRLSHSILLTLEDHVVVEGQKGRSIPSWDLLHCLLGTETSHKFKKCNFGINSSL